MTRGRPPRYPNLWHSAEFFWNFSLGDGPFVYDYSGNGRNGTITGGVGVNQFFDDVSGIHPGLRCLRKTGSGGHITGANYPSFGHEAAKAWTVVLRFSVDNTAGDDRTLYAYSKTADSFQFAIRTDKDATPPTDIEVYHDGNKRISAIHNIELDTPYVLSVTNDGLESSTSLRLRVYDALSGKLLSTQTGLVLGDAGSPSLAIFWVGAKRSDTEDPHSGTHCGVYVYSRVLPDPEIQIIVDDWLAPLRPAKRQLVGQVAAGQTVVLGVATETDTALSVTVVNPKFVVPTIATETDTALPVTALNAKFIALTPALETDTALSITVVNPKFITPAAATETDTALPVTVVSPKFIVLAVATETDTALPIIVVSPKFVILTPALETDTALGLGVGIGLDIAVEADTALPITVVSPKFIVLTPALETDTALPVAALLAKIIVTGVATETDTALDVIVPLTLFIDPGVETDTALPLFVVKTIAVGITTETDTALAVTPLTAKIIVVGVATETDTALAAQPRRTYAIGLSSETDTALVAPPVRQHAVTIPSETDTALMLTRLKTELLALGIEIDTALSVTIVGGSGISPSRGRSVRMLTPTRLTGVEKATV